MSTAKTIDPQTAKALGQVAAQALAGILGDGAGLIIYFNVAQVLLRGTLL